MDPDYVMSVIHHRAPEVADEVVPAAAVQQLLEIADTALSRLERLEQAVLDGSGMAQDGQDEAEAAETASAT
jgi:hypothetical protein